MQSAYYLIRGCIKTQTKKNAAWIATFFEN